MSDLLSTPAGQASMRVAVCDILRRRIARFFGRKTVVEFNNWLKSGKTAFSFAAVLGELNEQHDQHILDMFELLGEMECGSTEGGACASTFEDMDLYVDNVDGDDVEGIGSQADPWATIGRALDSVRCIRIDHRIRILVARTAGTEIQTEYEETTWMLDHTIRLGSLAVIGVGQSITVGVTRGVASVNALGNGGHLISLDDERYTEFELVGKFVMTKGVPGAPLLSNAYAIHYNIHEPPEEPVDQLYTRHYPSMFDDSYDITACVPAIRANLDQVTIDPTVSDEPIYAPQYGVSRIAFVNIELNFEDSQVGDTLLSALNSEVWMDFVVVKSADAATFEFLIQQSYINWFPPVDQSLQEASETLIPNIGDATNCPGLTFCRTTPAISDTDQTFSVGGKIHAVVLSGQFTGHMGNTQLVSFAANTISSYRAEFLAASQGLVSVLAGTRNSGISLDAVDSQLIDLYIQECDYAITADFSRLEIWDGIECDATVDYALHCEHFVQCRVTGAMIGFVGTVRDIHFSAVSPAVDHLWPAVAGTSLDDGMVSTPCSVVARVP